MELSKFMNGDKKAIVERSEYNYTIVYYLNEKMLKAIEAYHPPVVRGHPIKIKFITQLPTAVPSFAFFCNFPDDIKTPYKNYLENQLRSHFNLTGVPVRLFFRKK